MLGTLAGGDQIALSHDAGTALWGISGCLRNHIEVTVPLGHDYNAPDVTPHWTRHFKPEHVQRRYGIAVLSVARCIVDVASRKSPAQMFDIMDDAFLRKLSSSAEVQQVLDDIGGRGRSGTRLVRALLTDYSPGNKVPRSTFERRFFTVLDDAGIRQPRRRAIVETRMGPLEVDFLWEPELVVVEADSRRYHDTVLQVEEDSERRRALTAVGCAVMPVRWAALKYRPHVVVGDVLDALASRRNRAA
jgi:very-short-patch-repair endonuclease